MIDSNEDVQWAIEVIEEIISNNDTNDNEIERIRAWQIIIRQCNLASDTRDLMQSVQNIMENT